jgi:hypothetical protein
MDNVKTRPTPETLEQMEARHAAERAALEAKAVDPLLIEAREIVIATTPQPQRNFEIRKAEIRRGWKDEGFCVQIALAALRRGMELAAPPPLAPAEPVDEPFAWVDKLEWHKAAHRAVMASVKLGGWMSAALEDSTVCDAMKVDIREWFSAGEPMQQLVQALSHRGARWPVDFDVEALALDVAEDWVLDLSAMPIVGHALKDAFLRGMDRAKENSNA